MSAGAALLINAAAAAAVAGLLAASGRLFGPRSAREGDMDMPYETGLAPLTPGRGRMAALYWRFAVLFVVFDVDLAFLLPWTLARPAQAGAGLLAATVFIGLVLFMLAYAWRKGALECR